MSDYRFDEKNHIHLYKNIPLHGTSTVSKIIGGGSALQWWASGMAVSQLGWIKKEYAPEDKYKKKCLNEKERLTCACHKLSFIMNMNHIEYLDLLDIAYKAHSVRLKESAEKGVDLHKEIEFYVKCKIEGKDVYAQDLKTFIEWSEKNVKKWLFSELHVYSEELWTGGIIDCGYLDLNDNFCLGDFKSGSAWMSAAVQLGGYAKQLVDNMGGFDKDGNKIFDYNPYSISKKDFIHAPKECIVSIPHSLAIFPFKGVFKEPVIISGQTNRYMRAFSNALELYKLQKEFDEVIKNGK
jgi:hypothetical protein